MHDKPPGLYGMTIDWEQTTKAERRCLNSAAKAARQRLNINWRTLFQRAFGLDDNVGDGYEGNLRKGAVSAGKAYKLFTWLSQQDRMLAEQVESEIFALRAAAAPDIPPRWEALIKRGQFNRVRVIKARNQLGIVDFARRELIDPAALKLFDEFYFEIDAPLSGQMLAFQGYGGQWYTLPLATNASDIGVMRGKVVVPADDAGQPEPLCEEEQTGRYQFVFLIVTGLRLRAVAALHSHQPIPARIRDDIARAVLAAPSTDWDVLRTNLVFNQN